MTPYDDRRRTAAAAYRDAETDHARDRARREYATATSAERVQRSRIVEHVADAIDLLRRDAEAERDRVVRAAIDRVVAAGPSRLPLDECEALLDLPAFAAADDRLGTLRRLAIAVTGLRPRLEDPDVATLEAALREAQP